MLPCACYSINLVTKVAFWPFSSKKDNRKASETEDDETGDLNDEEDGSILELTVAERKMGENVLKKIHSFGSAIGKSNQKMTTLEEACTYHGIKFLWPIKVVKAHWNSQCNAFKLMCMMGG